MTFKHWFLSLMTSLVLLVSPSSFAQERVLVALETSMGTVEVELNPVAAPVSVENFLTYVAAGHYDNTLFHRVIDGFMVQGGGYRADMSQKATLPPITNEADNGLTNDRGTIAMARRGEINSATSQFFINLVDNRFLNHGYRDFGYAVFGKIVRGMEIVDAIGKVATNPRNNQPVEPVLLKRVVVLSDADAS